MDCILMHKNVPVADLQLDQVTGYILRVREILAVSHMPVGVPVKRGVLDRAALNGWWIDRSIPASRSGVRKAMEILGLENPQMLLTRCLGLSLSDQYWMKPKGQDIQWEDVNFFDHPFSEDIGDLLLGKPVGGKKMDFQTPDNTSDGFLPKQWKILHGRRCLLKGGSAPFVQQPFNEVIASRLMERLGTPHVTYSLLWDSGKPYSVCEDFISPETELVSAWRVMQIARKDNSTSVYQHFINCCRKLGLTKVTRSLDQMLAVDYLLLNEDRHLNNFGLVRNADTLEWVGMAPIYDSGTSLGYDKLSGQIVADGFGDRTECKPFKRTHREQIQLISSLDWLRFDQLMGFSEEIREILSGAGEYADPARIQAISTAFEERLKHLEELALTHRTVADNPANDVEVDVAADYTHNMNL